MKRCLLTFTVIFAVLSLCHVPLTAGSAVVHRQTDGNDILVDVAIRTVSQTGMERSEGFALGISREAAPQTTGSIQKGVDTFNLKIDLLKVTPSGIVLLKTDTIKAGNHIPVDYKFGFRPSESSEIISFTLKILPTIIKEQPLAIQFKINLLQGDREVQEKDVVIGPDESVIVELLENKKTASTLSFRLTPMLKSPAKGETAYPEKSYSTEKEYFEDPDSHHVDVDVKLLPIFAVDASGNPVYDLKKEEIEFSVNGNPMEILYLKPYEFGKKDDGADAAKKDKDTLQKEPDRVVVIIVDQVFNSWSGIRRAKEITENLIKRGADGDFFILMTNTPAGGLKYIAGPSNNKKQLLAKTADLAQLPQKRVKGLYSTLGLSRASGDKGDIGNDKAYAHESEDDSQSRWNETSEGMQYKADVQRFSYVLSQFKYALKTIEKPKIVFLVSRGVARDSFDEVFDLKNIEKQMTFDVFLFDYFKKIAQAVNQGGSLLYTINSQKVVESIDRGKSGKTSLEAMADASGGEYFSGADAVELAGQVNRTLSAYYELVFKPGELPQEGMTVSIRSKRRGVKVHSVKYSEIERPYHKMENIQKKLFALNVIQGGNWSRMVAQIEKGNSKTLKKQTKDNEISIKKLVHMPEGLKDQEVDIFLIRMNQKTQKTRIDMVTSPVKDTAEINITGTRDEILYFVVIEPKYVRCIYNRVR